MCGSRKNWEVVVRHGNFSYFEYPKGQFHSSDYSTVRCSICPNVCFRTKAKYVDDLPDAKED